MSFVADLNDALQPGSLEEEAGMGMVINATLVDGEFSPSSQVQYAHHTEADHVLEGYQEFASVDDLVEWVGSFDGDTFSLVGYVNDLFFAKD